jgi:hypothetical protein
MPQVRGHDRHADRFTISLHGSCPERPRVWSHYERAVALHVVVQQVPTLSALPFAPSHACRVTQTRPSISVYLSMARPCDGHLVSCLCGTNMYPDCLPLTRNPAAIGTSPSQIPRTYKRRSIAVD